MCEPTTIIYGMMAVASAASSYSQAEAQEETIEKTTEIRRDQIDDATAQQNRERARAARRERARIEAMAGESGVGGNSVSAQIMDSRFQEGRDVRSNRVQALWQKQGAASQAANQLSQVPSKASIATNAGLKIGSAYMSQEADKVPDRQNTTTRGGPNTPSHQ